MANDLTGSSSMILMVGACNKGLLKLVLITGKQCQLVLQILPLFMLVTARHRSVECMYVIHAFPTLLMTGTDS